MPRLFCLPHPPQPSRRAGFCPARAVKHHKFDRADANTHAPVGADASVRPARRTHENKRANANPHTVCRGRCPHRPARRTTVFTPRCGKSVVAQRADRVVRPYKTFFGFAEHRAILRLRAAGSMWASTPTDVLRCRRKCAQMCLCILHGWGRTPSLRSGDKFAVTAGY